jgi:hypothetical protein
MFVNHDADPTKRMGGLVEPHKAGKSTRLGGASLKMTGVLDVDGDSAAADIRRDVAQGISVGDITAMSGRWDPQGDPTPRAALPKSHYAFSDVGGGFSTPLFFANATVLEGSIVGVGSDSAALIGRAQDANRPEHVREFYARLTAVEPDPAIADALARSVDLLARVEELEADLLARDVAREEEELAGVRAVDVTTPEEAERDEPVPEAVRSEPELLEMASGLRPEFVEDVRRQVHAIQREADRKRTQFLYEQMGFIDND